jgi:hypothetical protein
MANKPVVVQVSPNGEHLTVLYDDRLLPVFSKLGQVTINRVSDVFFDNDIGKWRIGQAWGVLPETFETRAEAIECEINFINEALREKEGATASGGFRVGKQQ